MLGPLVKLMRRGSQDQSAESVLTRSPAPAFRPLGRLLGRIASKQQRDLARDGKPSATALLEQCHALLNVPDEASSVATASNILQQFRSLEDGERIRFFRGLIDEFQPDRNRLRDAAKAYLADDNALTITALGKAAEPPRQELFRLLNVGSGSIAAILDLRDSVLRNLPENRELEPLNEDLLHLLRSWFNRGFLSLERITWDTPASVLEKLIGYESVHQVRDWNDMQRRLADDRRYFAFFHPQLADDPLIFVEVALVNGLASSMDSILRPAETRAEAAPDTAIFYSINNCHRGLRNITFGNFLIKQVVEMLAGDLPTLKCFATLSPIPGFRTWLDMGRPSLDGDAHRAIEALEALDPPAIRARPDESTALRPILMTLCAHYLLYVKRVEQPLDPVARFHLRNGARIERINWLGDLSDNGWQQSFGILVNYVYDPATIAANREVYAKHRKIVCSPSVKALADKAP